MAVKKATRQRSAKGTRKKAAAGPAKTARKKATGPAKTARKKATGPAKKAARVKAAKADKRETAAPKKAAKAQRTPAAKKAARAKPSPATKRSSATKEAGPSPAKKPGKPGKRKGKIRAAEVNLGQIFQLRPRVNTSFKPDELRAAKQALEAEGYASPADAARAVAEKALELNRQKPGRHGFRGR